MRMLDLRQATEIPDPMQTNMSGVSRWFSIWILTSECSILWWISQLKVIFYVSVLGLVNKENDQLSTMLNHCPITNYTIYNRESNVIQNVSLVK